MKSNLLLILMLFFQILSHAQTIPGVESNLSPGGKLEIIYDRFGNQYALSDVATTPKKEKKSGAILQSVPLCNPGIFNLYFEEGSGMEGNTTVEIQRRAVVCQVFQDLSNFINTPLKNVGNTTRINFWVRDIAQIQPNSANVLGSATGFYNVPAPPIPSSNGGIIDNEIWKTIHTGTDSYLNNFSPTANSANSAGFYHGMMGFNFINHAWSTNLSAIIPSNQFDLYTVVLHEVTHALGFTSLINPDGTSNFAAGNYYSRYDTFLRNSNNQNLITATGACTTMYNNTFNTNQTDLHPTCTNPNGEIAQNTSIADATTCPMAVRYVGNNGTIPVYTPNCFERGSSLSHFEDMCFTNPVTSTFYGNNNYFVMSNANGQGVTKRHLTPEERNTLCDIGYSLSNEYALGQSYAFTYNTPVCNGVRVAGVNDGIATNAYSFIGNTNTPITITNILNNDVSFTAGFNVNTVNDLRFECVQDVYDSTALITSNGNTSTAVITFQSAISGVHLLRYVPFSNSTGLRGNVTYIYVYVSNNCGTPVACDLIINGGFEQNSELPFGLSQINFACNWRNGNAGSPDYFRTDALSPLVRIPNNLFGNQVALPENGNAYAGFLVSPLYREHINTRLKNPLTPNTNYQLTFQISIAENTVNSNSFNTMPIRLQAYLSPTAPTNIAQISELPINANGILLNNNIVTNNLTGWDTITFNFNSGTTAAQEFLTIGKLTNLDIPQVVNPLAYYYIDNVSLIALESTVFNLPTAICSTRNIEDLSNNLANANPTGVFTGPGVALNNDSGIYLFNASVAGLGTHTITYSYTTSTGCAITLTDTIIVDNNCAEPFITQIYHEGGFNQFIEIKNNSTVDRLVGNKFFLALYQDGALTSGPPTSFVPISNVRANGVWLFRNQDITEPADALNYEFITTLPENFEFDGDNDILIITTTSDATSYSNRIDLAGNANAWGFNTSWVRSSCATQIPRADAFDTDDWVEFTREEVIENQTNRTNPRLGRHNSDPLTFSPTGAWEDNSIDGSRVEKSRFVRLNSNYNTGDNGSFECCSLQLNNLITLTINQDTYVSVQINVNVLDFASINVENNGSLVMVKDSYNGVSGNDLVNLGTSAGVAVVKETVAINSQRDYVFWSSPLTLNPNNLPANSVANLFPTSNFNTNRFYGFNNSNFYDQYSGGYPQTSGVADGFDDNGDDYFVLNTSQRNSLMVPGRGYTTWSPFNGTNYNVNFNGQTNNGIVRVPVYRNDSSASINDNLVGNPYPSSIDLNRLFEVNQNLIDPYAAIWGRAIDDSPSGGNQGPLGLNYSEDNFLIYSPTMVLDPASGNTAFNAEGILSSCQSFFVQTTTNPAILQENNTGLIQYAGDLIFNNSMRSTNTQPTFARGIVTDSDAKIWLQLQDKDKINTAALGIAFLDKGTDTFNNKEDVKAIRGRKLSFYTQSNCEDLIIDAQSTFDTNKTIPLGLARTTSKNSSYEISLSKATSFFDKQPIYLTDLTLGIVHNLSRSSYEFQTDTPVTDGRFVLQFTNNVTTKTATDANDIKINFLDDSIEIISNKTIQNIEVSDIYTSSIGGMQIAKLNDINANKATLCLNKSCSLIVVKTTMYDGSIITKKLAR